MNNQNKTKKNIKILCVSAVFMALNVVMSSFSIPVPGGHLYFNDIIICTAAILLSPAYAFCVGGIGAFLGDLLFYPLPMFVSLITHGLQAIVISLCSRHLFKKKPIIGSIVGVFLGAVIMVVGYTIGRAFIYSTVEYAILKLPYQIAQAVVGAVFGIILCYPCKLKKIFDKMFA